MKSKEPSTQLSQKIEVAASTIRAIRNQNNIFPGRIKFNPPIEEFIEIYEQLKTSTKVAKYYNVDHHTVIDFAKRIDYDYKNRDEIADEQKKYIIENYDCKSAKQLSEELGIKQSAISGIWYRNGLNGKQRRQYSINEHVLDNIDTEEKAYFLGFFAADGCVSNNTKKQDTITFSLLKEDGYILERFYNLFESNKPVRVYGEYAHFEISSNYICDKIYELGFSPRKTYSNTFCLLSDELMPHFIRGYFDGDGCVTENKNWRLVNNISISGYENNMNKLIDFLKNKNITTTFMWDKRKKYV